MNFKIRKATPDDEEIIRTIAEKAWLFAYSHIFGRDAIIQKFESRKHDKDYINEQLDELKNTNKHHVACIDDNIVGFVSISENAEYFEITRLYVNPVNNRQGVGKKLFDYAVNIAKEKNFTTMRIEALKENFIGCNFYTKTGGKVIDTWSKGICGVEAEMVAFEYNL